MELSIELGCFVAGINMNSAVDSRLRDRLVSIRDFFSCIFFASIGIHIYPTFLLNQAMLLLITTAGLMSFKTLAMGTVLHLLDEDTMATATISVGLSQISEFAFVLASRGKSLKILNKEAYYFLLGTTSLSLAATPFLWKLVKSTRRVRLGGKRTDIP